MAKKVISSNPINASGEKLEDEVTQIFEDYFLEDGDTVLRWKKKDPSTHPTKGGNRPEVVRGAVNFQWLKGKRSAKTDFTVWNPYKGQFLVECRRQTVNGSVEAKLFETTIREFKCAPPNCTLLYVYDVPGISSEYLDEVESQFEIFRRLYNKQFRIFRTVKSFKAFISKPLDKWDLPKQ